LPKSVVKMMANPRFGVFCTNTLAIGAKTMQNLDTTSALALRNSKASWPEGLEEDHHEHF
jgi:hypothetical protein